MKRNPETDILQLSTHYSDMASFFRERGYPGDYDKARSYYQKAERGMKQIYGDKPHPEMAAFYDGYALLYDNMGKYSEALSLFQKALEIKQKTLKREHPDIIQSYGSIGLIYYELTEYDKALDCLNEALEIADKIWPVRLHLKQIFIIIWGLYTGVKETIRKQKICMDVRCV